MVRIDDHESIDVAGRRKISTRKFWSDRYRWNWHRDRRLAAQAELRRLVELVGPMP